MTVLCKVYQKDECLLSHHSNNLHKEDPRSICITLYTTNITSPVLYVHTNKGVLLQTTRTVVTNPHHPRWSLDVRVILDSGNQCFYIMEHTRESLGLEARGRRTMSIMTFGSQEKRPQECSVVKVIMQLKDEGEQQLQMLSVPFICQPLTVPPVRFHPGEFAHLCRLELADTFGEEREFQPDILIGSDIGISPLV